MCQPDDLHNIEENSITLFQTSHQKSRRTIDTRKKKFAFEILKEETLQLTLQSMNMNNHYIEYGFDYTVHVAECTLEGHSW